MFYIRISVFEIAVKIGMTIVWFVETLKNVKMYKHKDRAKTTGQNEMVKDKGQKKRNTILRR